MSRTNAVILVLVTALCAGLIYRAASPGEEEVREPARRTSPEARVPPPSVSTVPLFSAGFIDDSGYDLGVFYTPAIRDRSSLPEVIDAHKQRAARGREDVARRLADLERMSPRPPDFEQRRAMAQVFGGLVEMFIGDFVAARGWFERAHRDNPGIEPALRQNIGVLRGIAALRQGEIENCVECVGPSSCIYPITEEAKHLKPEGSRLARDYFLEYLKDRPEDHGVRWLLNIAAMTLAEHPASVPERFRILPDVPTSGDRLGRFANVTVESGLSARGPNMLGGSIFDDFNGDRLPDVFISSGDATFGASCFLNNGDGTFSDTADPVLKDQPLAVNANQADFDNDGDLDVLMLRGGWESPYRLTLLRNRGKGTFDDVTVDSGLADPIATQTAAWGDFDNDGLVDVFVGGEFRPQPPDARNRSRLYRNLGGGKFRDVAATAGVANERWCKGAAWGDYDDDGDLDLHVSNMNAANRLYRNDGNGTFTDVAPKLGLVEPIRSFSCWFWDYDDDGRLDLFVTGFGANVNDVIADRLGHPTTADRPRLYRNLGKDGFRDVTKDAGLDHVYAPMGSNFADFDNDGRLDFYLATGRPAYSFLIPNLMFRNIDGRRFEDVTAATGTGHLQKGHSVSFADHDRDGDLDLFVQTGGQAPGDRAHNVLFRNPGHGRNWIGLKLIGTRTNRAAIGVRLRLDIRDARGQARSLHRTIGSGSSFGGNSLATLIGIDEATKVDSITVNWPTSKTAQTFRGLPAGGWFEITEGSDSPQDVPPATSAPKQAAGPAPRR